MSDERDLARLSNASSGSDDALRALLGSARGDDPSSTELASLTDRLGPLLGPPTPPSGGTGGSSPPAAPTLGGSGATATKLGLGGAVIVGLIALATSALRTRSPLDVIVPFSPIGDVAGRPATSPVENAGNSSPAVITAPETVPTALASSAPSVGRLPASSSGVNANAEPHEDEVHLLRRAHAALLAGRASEALSIADEHARAYPRGSLGQEREVIRIEALLRVGRASEARAKGEAFIARFPTSTHARRVATLLGLENEPKRENDASGR